MAAETREQRMKACLDEVRALCFRWADEEDNGDMGKWDCAEEMLSVLSGYSFGEPDTLNRAHHDAMAGTLAQFTDMAMIGKDHDD